MVDCFDALTSDRPYRRGKSFEDAMTLITSLSGTQFDPTVVDIFRLHCLEVEQQIQRGHEGEFIPLNTEVSVWRGAAPGAGFEEQNDATDEVHEALEGRVVSIEETSAFHHLLSTADHEAEALSEISDVLGNLLTLEEAIAVMVSRLHRLIPFNCCALYLKCGNTLALRHVDGVDAQYFSTQAIPMGEGISGWVAQSGKSILNGNAGVESSYHNKKGSKPLQTGLSIPLFHIQEEVLRRINPIRLPGRLLFERSHARAPSNWS